MKAHSNDSVLIEQVMYLVSKAREATGQEPMFDLPKGGTSSWSCPIQQGLNLKCSVTSSTITFPEEKHAQLVAEACGLKASGKKVLVPSTHPFGVFVSRFDSGMSKRLNQLRKSR